MNLAFRPKPVADFDRYFELDYVGGLGFDPGCELKEFVREEHALFNEVGQPCWMVAHDLDRETGREIGLLGGCYLTDWATQELIDASTPYPHPKFLKWHREGRCPFVKGIDIGRANAGDGLNLILTHFGWDRTLDEEEAALVRSLCLVRFTEYYAGAKYKRMIAEVYSEASYAECANAGYESCNTYPNWSNADPLRPFKPVLMVLERQKALRGSNHFIMNIFSYQKPQVQFSEGQREVLLLARFGYTDQAIAQEICISEDAVKARWKSIYAKVEERLPGLLPEADQVSRGPEKRRLLLSYLQNHPSEFWPYNP